MDFDQYIDLTDPDGAKLVGHRIWLDQLLYEVVQNRCDVDQLIERFPTLDRQTIYACLLYFEQNRTQCLTRLYADIDRAQANHVNASVKNEAMKRALLQRAGLIPARTAS
jgi:uncharacterized protein (DUF433 family)